MTKKVTKKVAKKAPVKKVKKKAAKHIRKGKLPEPVKVEEVSFLHAQKEGNGLWSVQVENMEIGEMMALVINFLKQIADRMD